jgi:phosphohistidine swiveling domain-containing protein
MTFPSFISAMQKAVAFVTDEGGITCHAAIIAREMKKPCIIGTKIATQILKDGDLVEVDADNGVVRVIEGKKEEKIFDKFISRYYCIMHLEKYNQFLGEMCEEIGIPKFYPIFVYDSKKRLSTIYYNTSELDTLIKGICKKTDEDLIFREKVISEYKKYFNEVKEYLDLSIKINSKKEFEKFSIIFENYLKYNAYNWVLSGANLLSGETKEESEKLRKETEVYASKRDKVLELFAKELFHNDELDVFFMSSLEFINEKYDIGEIKERENGFLWCNGEIILKRNIPQFLDSKKFNLREPISDNSSIIKGTIANKGCVSGIVKIIYTERDLFRITSEEDILVSPMTRPEFIPAIKKAKAIITDEGGITCHAAIVSRELNKPCIIGTKIATQVLKDGDIVEVDANNGIVRVIK